MPRPFPDPQQGHTTPKVHHPDLGGESSQVAWNEIHDSDRRQRNVPKHSSDVKFMTTMFTPRGRYRWTRLPFVISSASEEWQCQIHMVLKGLQVISIADDILIPGCGDTDAEARIDHDCNLIAVLEQFEEHHVKLNVNKMKFLVHKAVFMGHVITTDGLQPNPVTVQAVVNMPIPMDKQGVCRFLGAIS